MTSGEREFSLATYPNYPSETLVYRPDRIDEPLDLQSLFQGNGPIEVELGAGDGSFLLAYASAHPEKRFFAVERLLGRLKKIDKQGRRRGIQNICCLRLQSEYVVRHLIPKGKANAIHVYFPDPWPKAKHERNRLIRQEVVEDFLELLAPGGQVFLRTDNVPYFELMQEVFAGVPGLKPSETPQELQSFTTDFERLFNSQGLPTNYLAYIKAS